MLEISILRLNGAHCPPYTGASSTDHVHAPYLTLWWHWKHAMGVQWKWNKQWESAMERNTD